MKFEIDSSNKVILKKDNWLLFENDALQDFTPKYLYKYYALNENSINAISENYFYLSNPKDFNDPFDCNKNLIIDEQKELNNWEYVKILNDISDIGISCFSENELEPLLWSHYTKSYNGFCIKYNVDKIIRDCLNLCELKKVIYSKDPNPISLTHPFSKYYKYILKLNNWSYEREWRILVKNPELVERKLKYSVDCVEEIYIGYKFNSNKKNDEELFYLFNKLKHNVLKDVPIYVVGPHQTKLKLSKVPLFEGKEEDAMEMLKQLFRVD